MSNTNRPGISTHVLDTKRGEPAAGVPVTLARIENGRPVVQSSQETNADGRIANLLSGALAPGTYQLTFDVATYFRKRGDAPVVFAKVVLEVEIGDASRNHHIPLLVSPFSCTSYRGS